MSHARQAVAATGFSAEAFGTEPVEAADRADALEKAWELHPGYLMAALEAERVPDDLRQYVLASWLKTL